MPLDLTLGLTLRPFQERALERLRERLAEGERRLHLVAPPGAGKTVLGLAFLLERGEPALIASPTSTIAAQWVERFREFAIDPMEPDAEGIWGERIGTDPRATPLPPVLSTTYQAMSVRSGEGFHDNVHELFERLAAHGVRTLVLDECHHLKNTWAEAIAVFLDQVPDAVVLGLTATPPVDASAEELDRHLTLLGDVDYEIPLPALVRSGHLVPWQDLVHLVMPTAAEASYVASAHARFHTLLEQLRAPPADLAPLGAWLHTELAAIAAGRRDAENWTAWLAGSPDEAIALCRVLFAHDASLPGEAWEIDEMLEPPTLEDQALALDLYHRRYLAPMADEGVDSDGLPVDVPLAEAAAALRNTLREAMRPVGYVLTSRGLQRRSSAVDRLLGLSAAKLPALGTILEHEQRALTDDLRAVIVTDFERASTGQMARTLSGVLDPEAGGAVSVLRYLATHPELGVLDAVMITGQSLICDADVGPLIVDAFRRQAAAHDWKLEVTGIPEEGHLWRIEGRGSDWTSARYVLLVTELFERGTFRCIVGTRGLLGEGWDVRSANVLIDLTAVAAFVSTNQLRGRCLRLDPHRPEKVAHLWDIVAIAPREERGFADWHRFIRKHSHVPGLAEDGAIETGVGHVHPAFTHLPPAALAEVLPEINAEMFARIDHRPAARRAWRIGEPFRGEVEKRTELRFTRPASHGGAAAAARRDGAPPAPGLHAARLRRLQLLQQAARREEERAAAEDAHARFALEAQRAALHEHARQQRKQADRQVRNARLAEGAAWVLPPGLVAATPVLAFLLAPQALLLYAMFGAAGSFVLLRKLRRRRQELVAQHPQRLLAVEEGEQREAAALEEQWARAQEIRSQTRGSLVEAMEAARAAMEAPVGDEEAALLYGTILQEAFATSPDGIASRARWAGLRLRTALRSDGSASVWLEGANAEEAASFAEALRDWLRPVGESRYLLALGEGANHEHNEGVMPLPEYFCRRRERAQAFTRAWMRYAGPATLYYTLRGEGAELRARHMRTRWNPGRAWTREVWR